MTNQDQGNKEQDSTGLVIKDRRRFDAQGALRAQEPDAAKNIDTRTEDTSTVSAILDRSYQPQKQQEAAGHQAGSHQGSGPRSAVKPTQQPTPEEEDEGDINSSSFVVSLATQASIQLGLLTPPPGMDAAVDLEAAKQTIDILGLVERKTRGNLNDQEKNLLLNILHELRIGYVQIMKSRGVV